MQELPDRSTKENAETRRDGTSPSRAPAVPVLPRGGTRAGSRVALDRTEAPERQGLFVGGFFLAAGVTMIVAWDYLPASEFLAWGLTFGGGTAVAVLAIALYRVQLELRTSRRLLIQKEAELSFALQVQKALFPRELPRVAGLSFSAAYVPARGIGGDCYDVLRPADGRLLFAIADISGKGVPAAILMANLQAMLRVVSSTSGSPVEICHRLNTHFFEISEPSWFATLFLAEWSHPERSLRYVNAGHNPPILVGSNGGGRLDRGGLPLGLFPSVEYEPGEVQLQDRDLLLLYSDGVTEAANSEGEEFGIGRLAAVVEAHRDEPLERIQSSILQGVQEWSPKEPEDDMTLLLVGVGEREGEG